MATRNVAGVFDHMAQRFERASSPATRTADGPMSTPRRDCPRSSGTPITRIFLGAMLDEDAVDGAIDLIRRARCLTPAPATSGSIGCYFAAVTSSRFSALHHVYRRNSLWVQPVQHARERNRLPHVLQPADPGHGAFDSHAETAVGHAAEFAQVKVPLESLFGKAVFAECAAPADRRTPCAASRR